RYDGGLCGYRFGEALTQERHHSWWHGLPGLQQLDLCPILLGPVATEHHRQPNFESMTEGVVVPSEPGKVLRRMWHPRRRCHPTRLVEQFAVALEPGNEKTDISYACRPRRRKGLVTKFDEDLC